MPHWLGNTARWRAPVETRGEFRGAGEERPIVATLREAAEGDTGVSVGEVDESAARSNLDHLARRFLGMSGEDFLRLRREIVRFD